MEKIIKTIETSRKPLIICSAEIKKHLIKTFSKGFKNIIYKSYIDVKKDFFGEITEEMIYDYCFKHNVDCEVSKMKLESSLFVDGNYDDKKLQELSDIHHEIAKDLNVSKLIINKYKDREIFLVNYYYDDNLVNKALKEIEKFCKILNLHLSNNRKELTIKYFNDIDKEVQYTVNEIAKLIHQGVPANKIIINKSTGMYALIFKEMFKLYNIHYDLQKRCNLFSYELTKDFLKELNASSEVDFEKAFTEVYQRMVENSSDNKLKILKAIGACGSLLFKYHKTKDELSDYLLYSLKNKKIELFEYENIIRFENVLDNVYEDDVYVFIPHFNQDAFPKTLKNNNYLSDADMEKLGLITTTQMNVLKKQAVIDFIHHHNNLSITYALHSPTEVLVKNTLIDRLSTIIDVKVELIDYKIDEVLSKNASLIKYRKALDEFNKYNYISEDLVKGNKTFFEYDDLRYDPSFKGIDSQVLDKYIENGSLSYTVLDNLFKCPFNFYLKYVLKISKDRENQNDNINLLVGSLYHYIFENLLQGEMDIEKLTNQYLEKNEIKKTKKLDFYIKKLQARIEEDYKIIIYYMDNSAFKPVGFEEKLSTILKNGMPLVGSVDKILKYNDYYIVIDYKTKDVNVTWKHLSYGLDLQLPIYFYLLNKNKENVKFGGAYLQSILENSPFKYDEKKDYEYQKREARRYKGYTSSLLEVVEKIDFNYDNSNRSLPYNVLSKDGFSKLFLKASLNDDEFKNLLQIVEGKLNDAEEIINNGQFTISPFEIKNLEDSCKYCNNRDICFLKPEKKELKEKIENLDTIRQGGM